MIIALVSLIVLVLLVAVFMKSLKLFFMTMLLSVLIISAGVYFIKPVQHKQFAIQVVDYLINFNTDGSITTTKQTTTTQIQKDTK